MINTLLLAVSIPLSLGKWTFWFILLLLPLCFLYVAFSPACKKRESIWLFVLCALALSPFNVRFLFFLGRFLTEELGPVGKVSFFICGFSVLFSLEELLIGIIGSAIWKEPTQPSFPDKFDVE